MTKVGCGYIMPLGWMASLTPVDLTMKALAREYVIARDLYSQTAEGLTQYNELKDELLKRHQAAKLHAMNP